MAKMAILIPSLNEGIPKVNLSKEFTGSTPIVPSARPNAPIRTGPILSSTRSQNTINPSCPSLIGNDYSSSGYGINQKEAETFFHVW